ncbi:hypothetical protein BX616_003764, partial [Lobosporangium transversale]
AGAGGSSTAYFLNKFLQPPQINRKHDHSITIFDQDDKIGGRCTVFRVSDYHPDRNGTVQKDKYIEVGASIFVKANYNLVDAAKQFGLKTEPLADEMMAIWDGKTILFEESRWKYWSVFKGFRRWGFSPFKTFDSISEFARRFKLDKLASIMSEQFLESSGISKQYATEVIEVATRVNYGSNLHEIHTLGAMVSMAANDALRVQGGNFQIFEGMVGHSKAHVRLSTKIARVRRTKPEYEGADTKFEVITASGQKQVFDIVVIAAPIQSTNIDFDLDLPPLPEVEYRTIYATFVRGHVNPAYFKVPPTKKLPAHILSTNSEDVEVTSISIQAKMSNGETVTKIFSPKPIQEEHLDRLYLNRTWVKSKIWKAYPKLHPLDLDNEDKDKKTSVDPFSEINTNNEQVILKKREEEKARASWGQIEIVPGVFYVNALEPLISTMETETIAGENVARLVRDRILGYCPVEKITKRM